MEGRIALSKFVRYATEAHETVYLLQCPRAQPDPQLNPARPRKLKPREQEQDNLILV